MNRIFDPSTGLRRLPTTTELEATRHAIVSRPDCYSRWHTVATFPNRADAVTHLHAIEVGHPDWLRIVPCGALGDLDAYFDAVKVGSHLEDLSGYFDAVILGEYTPAW